MLKRIGMLVAGAVFFAIPAVVRAEPVTMPAGATTQGLPEEDFIRVIDNGAAGDGLQTSIVTFQNDAGVTVHLVSAVHIGEKDYYDGLAKTFDGYDALLYEMVKPKGMAVPAPGAGQESTSMISKLQRFMKDALDLDFQLDDIDYTKANFVHADMDAETFSKMQADRHETFADLMFRAVENAMEHPEANSDVDSGQMLEDMVTILTRPDSERQMKMVLAKQMQDIEGASEGLAGPDGTSVIVTERNKVALGVLKDTLASGKKNVGVFFGAAHMPDMSQHLMEMGFKPVDVEYRTAWDLTIRPDQPSAVEGLLKKAWDSL